VRNLALILCALNLGLPAGLLLYAALSGEDYWNMFWGERNAITWFSSVQLLLVAGAAQANHAVARLLQRAGHVLRAVWVWRVFAMGFVFLAIDEYFELHEALREQVLKPRHLARGLPWIRPGDIGIHLYLVVGLIFTFFLLRQLRGRRTALVLLAAGLVLTAATAIIDSLPREIEARISYFWTSVFEEGGEIWAQLLFMLAFLDVLHARLGTLALSPLRSGCDAAP
jgi:hypothetical protein